MTIKPTSILKTLVLGLAIIPVLVLPAAAQSRTTSQPARPTTTTTRPAPAPAPASARPATQTAAADTTAPATVGTTGAVAAAAAATIGTRPWNEQDYRLGPGDKLRVEVYGEPQLSQSLQVRPDGKITLSLVGDVQAAGHTPLELRDALAGAFSGYLRNADKSMVTVIVQDAIANQIVVSGEVGSPGQQVLLGPITILEAIAKAGGPGQWAKTGSIYVLRKTATGVQKIDANYKDALKGKSAPLILQPGDTVVVP